MQGIEWMGHGPSAPEAWRQFESSITRQACHSGTVAEYSLDGEGRGTADSAARRVLHEYLGDEFVLPSCGAMPGTIQWRGRGGGG